MIEVERKFIVTAGELARLIAEAVPDKVETHTDTYYDTGTYDLTKKSIWLRSRDGRFELKIPVGEFRDKGRFTRYEEIENEAAIAARLNISSGGGSFAAALAAKRYTPFATIATKRTKYKKDGLSIDVDEADYGYTVVEIEAMVQNEGETREAYEGIIRFAAAKGLEVAESQARGKVIEFIRRTNPEHFRALEKAWGMPL